jgi:hypothetical protein
MHHESYLKPFLSYLPCIVHREYFSIIFKVKKCAQYSIKYSKLRKKIFYRIHLKFSIKMTGLDR